MPVSSLEGARGTITDVRFDPTSRRVIAASWDGMARVWGGTRAVSPVELAADR
jgi:WD40 repeat protein